MNFIKFSTASTNVFPMANSTVGGQLLTEYNLRSRESVCTDSNVQYMIGPSYTHSASDFEVTLKKDAGIEVNNNIIQISEGRALVNGHFVESLTPITIDLEVANAEIKKHNSNTPSNILSELKGKLSIGLRTMYSTQPTTAGSLLIEDSNNMFTGIQVVILPESEFKLPSDVPENPNLVTAHLKLADFRYSNGVITNITQYSDKTASIGPDRISNIEGHLSKTYLSANGLDRHHHYVFTSKGNNNSIGSGFCEADECIMIWDADAQQKVSERPTTKEAMFRYNPGTYTTQLVVPHKQVDDAEDSANRNVYFPDKVIDLPSANYSAGTGGVVDPIYTANIHNIAETVERLFTLPNGGMKAYIALLEDKEEQLPRLSVQSSWQPGDYVLVGQDMVIEGDDDDDGSLGYPSTMYVVIPGKVESVAYVGYEEYPLRNITIDNNWDSMIKQLILSVDWRDVIAKNYPASPGTEEEKKEYWTEVVRKSIADVMSPVMNYPWDTWVDNYLNQDDFIGKMEKGWTQKIYDTWTAAASSYATDDEIRKRYNRMKGYPVDDPIKDADRAEYEVFSKIVQEMFSSITAIEQDSEGNPTRTTFPVPNVIETVAATIEEGSQAQQWGESITTAISNGIASVSGIDWGDIIVTNAKMNVDPTNIAWDTIISTGVIAAMNFNAAKIVRDNQDSKLPDELYGSEGIEIGRVSGDANFNYAEPESYNELLGISSEDMNREGYPRGRKDKDFFRIIVENEENNTLTHYFYVVKSTTDIEYSDPPIKLTGRIPLAYEDSIGGFYNVPETSLGNGYVYRNSDGYLQLLDYDLLATGVLAYQLGEDFTCPSGLAASEIQTALDEYVNNRVAFPNAAKSASAADLANSGDIGYMADPTVINVYIDLSGGEEDETYQINIQNIDSRFGGSVYLHVSGDGTGCILNITNCEKIRLDLNTTINPAVTLTDSCIYYDADMIDELDLISGLSLWYKRYTQADPDLTVSDMYVEYNGAPEDIKTEDFWIEESPNDNHYKYALKGLRFNTEGNICSATMLITCSSTFKQLGTYCSVFNFKFPQALGLQYPSTRLNKTIKITGNFVTAYPGMNQGGDTGYYVADTSFSAIAYPNDLVTTDMSGVISFKTNVDFINTIYGMPQTDDDNTVLPMSIDSWEPGNYHIFTGGTVDVHS